MVIAYESLYTATITFILVMNPMGNVPVFLSVLKNVDDNKRALIILRESLIAYAIIILFLYFGQYMLNSLNISEAALGMAGGILLFLISIKMIFPSHENGLADKNIKDPFIVPLAVPMLAGPAALAMVLLFASREPENITTWFLAVTIAALVTTLILQMSGILKKILREKGLLATEKLMGMILTTLSVEMFFSGITEYFKHHLLI